MDFWAHRLQDAAYPAKRTEATVEFADYEGLDLALVLSEEDEEPLRAHDPAIPKEYAITGIRGGPAHAVGEPGGADNTGLLTRALGFERLTDEYFLNGTRRSFRWAYDPAPDAPGIQGAGTVHHIAWACEDADQPAWRERVQQAGGQVTPVLDREYFHLDLLPGTPPGVLFEIATVGPRLRRRRGPRPSRRGASATTAIRASEGLSGEHSDAAR